MFRFILEKYRRGNRLRCPNCHRISLAHYIDVEDEIRFPGHVGRCNRQYKCAYHYSPRDYFRDNPTDTDGQSFSGSETMAFHLERPVAPSFHPSGLMEATMRGYDINPLFRFFASNFGTEATLRLFQRYHVGTSRKWGGAAVYWQVDSGERIRCGKIMGYDPVTGHRIKHPRPQVCWVHSELRLDKFCIEQCFFGEHLLEYNPGMPVAIVESEKSAMICSLFIPRYLWIATGGMSNVHSFSPLRSRTVVLVPDLGAEDEWEQRLLPALRPYCASIRLTRILRRWATPADIAKGYDAADLLMRDERREMSEERLRRSQTAPEVRQG